MDNLNTLQLPAEETVLPVDSDASSYPMSPMSPPSQLSPEESFFTENDVACFRATRDILLARGVKESLISNRELLLTVFNCKHRPESAADKYQKWLAALNIFGISSFDEVWGDLARDGSEGDWAAIENSLKAYAGCGRDQYDRSIMWIRGGSVEVADEKLTQRVAVMYFTAIHADMVSLRKGITFVIDTSSNDMTRRIGNEDKMQKGFQSVPLRPQRIFILGAGFFKRAIINTMLSIASLFTSEKVIGRVRFADLDEVRGEIPSDSMPTYLGGPDTLKDNKALLGWMRSRLQNFPKFDY